MKAGVQMLSTVLLVAGGLFAYHLLVVQPAHAPDPVQDDEPLDALAQLGDDDADPLPVSAAGGTDDPGLASEGDGKLARANAARIQRLERALKALQKLLVAERGPSGPRPDPLAPLHPQDLVDEEKPAFDPATMDTLTAYMDEIDRRRVRANEVRRIDQTLSALGLDLSDAKRKAIADVSLRMQARCVAELGGNELLPDERRRLIDDLRAQYTAALARVVPQEDVKAIVGSRIARRMGLTPSRERKDERNRR